MKSVVLLDLDGTLADSLDVMRQAFAYFLTTNSVNDSALTFDRFNGPPLPSIIKTIKVEAGLSAPLTELVESYERIVDDLYDKVVPIEGASEFLKLAREKGWRTGLVTSNSRPRTQKWLRRRQLDEFCDVIVCGSEGGPGKPDPAPYVTALNRLQCVAASAIAIEDSDQGVQSALSAGLTTFRYCPIQCSVALADDLSVPFASFAELRTLVFCQKSDLPYSPGDLP